MKVSDYIGSVSVLTFKLGALVLLGLVGVFFGFMAGGLFEATGIYAEELPWQEGLTLLGGLAGALLGLGIKVEK